MMHNGICEMGLLSAWFSNISPVNIPVTCHEFHGISNNRQLDWYTSSGLSKGEISNLHITGPLWGESTHNKWIPRSLMDSPHKGPVMHKVFPFIDLIMYIQCYHMQFSALFYKTTQRLCFIVYTNHTGSCQSFIVQIMIGTLYIIRDRWLIYWPVQNEFGFREITNHRYFNPPPPPLRSNKAAKFLVISVLVSIQQLTVGQVDDHWPILRRKKPQI